MISSMPRARARFASGPLVSLPFSLLLLLPVSGRTEPALQGAADLAPAIELRVDATDIDHRVLHVHERVPVQAGPMTLQYPRWIPGTHSPAGAVARLAGLQIRAGAASVAWSRDPVEMESFHVTVPAGAQALELNFDFLSSTHDTEENEVMRDLLAVNWRNLVLYPAGIPAADLRVQPEVTLPADWDHASALRAVPPEGPSAGATVRFAPMSLEMLIDSPLYSAPHMRHLTLDADPAHPVMLHLLANDSAQLAASDAQLAAHMRLVQQARAMFGARHYDHYDFILVIDDLYGFHGGLEHHQSSENGTRHGYFADWDKTVAMRALLPHEFVHSWNGKFRRPRDLWTAAYNTPMQDSLLWVYEGLTNYWGEVLAARSGLVSPEVARGDLAFIAATARDRPGRSWRNLQDTTNEPLVSSRGRRKDWPDWQRGVDYYAEGSLLWLAVDLRLRLLTNDRRSLDDFARAFYGVDDGRMTPELYGFEDLVHALDGVAHDDWAGFLRGWLDTHDSGGILAGLEQSGWHLAYADKPNDFAKSVDEINETSSLLDSLGLVVGKDGVLTRVVWDGPAFKAGLSPAATLVAVNGRSYRPDFLKQAVTVAKTEGKPLQLLVKESDLYRTVTVPYQEGLRFPRLERTERAHDYLSEIFAPR